MSHAFAQKNRPDVAFAKIKEVVTSAPVLKYFDSSKPTQGSGDASSQGLGFVLTQEDHPVTYASRALTQAEQRYSQIEKDALGSSVWLRTQPPVRLWQESCSLYRSQALGVHLK